MTESAALTIAGKVSASKRADFDGIRQLNLSDDAWAVYVKVDGNVLQIDYAEQWPDKVDSFRKELKQREKMQEAAAAMEAAKEQMIEAQRG